MDLSQEMDEKKALLLTKDRSFPRSALVNEMSSRGYRVMPFPDLERGWQYFEEELPPLVILDVKIGREEAYDMCGRIRDHASGRYTTILMANPPGSGADMEANLSSGINYCVEVFPDSRTLGGWHIEIDRRVNDLKDLQHSHQRIRALQKELDFMNLQLEDALTRANQQAVEAELAYLEMDQIFKTAAGGILVIDPESNVLRCNDAFLRRIKKTRKDMEGRKCHEVFNSRLCHAPDCPLELIKAGKRYVECEVEKKNDDGSPLFYMITSTPLRGPNSDLIAMVENIVDITPRVEAEKALRKSEEKFRLVSEKAPFGQSILSSNQTFEYFNPKFTTVFGYTLVDIPNMSIWMEKAYPDRTYRNKVLATLSDQEGGRDKGASVFTVTCKDGQEKIVDFHKVDLGDNRLLITYVDITDQRKAQEGLEKSEKKYRELSLVDDLTGLFNKRHLNDRLQTEIDRVRRYNHPLSLMLMDIDNFKEYNDIFGHTAGDLVLTAMGRTLMGNIRKSDSAYRYGGEEFVVIMPETPGSGALKVAERIRKKVASENFFPAPTKRIQKTISIGVAEHLPHDDVKTIIERADQNMYRAKENGKNRVVFS